MLRTFSHPIKRIVVKVGSSIITSSQTLKPRKSSLEPLVHQVSRLSKEGREVILVSSGAIAFGLGELRQKKRPTDISSLQALAAIGQNVLMGVYSGLFHQYHLRCAQVLLTWEDFDNRERFNNARNTLQAILNHRAVPVINENDTIATDEIKFGDNDRLSALVASMVQADLLIILSDVEGFYDLRRGSRHVLPVVEAITPELESMASGTSKKNISKGGMATKLQAIRIASHARIPSIIAHGTAENVLLRLVKGEVLGTLFFPRAEKLLGKKHWISFGAKPKGKIVVDTGARDALLKGGKSLLLPGVIAFEGRFHQGDVVIVADAEGREIARGVTKYAFADLQKMTDKKGKTEVIHCDQMVLARS